MSQEEKVLNSIRTEIESHSHICEQASDVIKSTNTSAAQNDSQRHLLEFDALLTHIRWDVMPHLIPDSEILFLVQTWLEQLHRPACIERVNVNKVANNG